MKTSIDRILTTHTGSLPRPKTLMDVILGREKGEAIDPAKFEDVTAKAVDEIVELQVKNGIDIVSDGEMSKPSYTTYIRHRVEGIQPDPRAAEKGRDIMIGRDSLAHPDFARLHYPNEDKYVEALAEMMKTEYRAIVEAGFVLQIDAPDLGSCRNNQYRDLSDDEFRKIAARNIEALNHATEGLPGEQMRLHICWGNYEGPHSFDLPLLKIIDIAFKARMQAISIEAANPRHDHEWEDLKTIKIPDDKILIPGVIDSTTNFIEHPKLVAQRIGRYADIVGRERVLAGVDCGFGTAVRTDPMVVDSIVWAKLKALAEGAAIASQRLWGAKAA